MATIKEIAELANVSMATVSRVLNKDEQIVVSDTVRNHIFTIAHELGYVPPKQRRIPIEDGITIGVADWHIIRADRTNQKLSDFSNMAKRYCKTPVRFVQVSFQEEITVNGIIALGHFTEAEVEFLNRQSCFLLFVDSNQENYQYDRILIDHIIGMKDFISYCRTNKKYEVVGYIGGFYENENVVIGKTRCTSFQQLLKENNLFQETCFVNGTMTRDSGYELAKKLIQEGKLPEAMLIGNEEIAEGVVQALEEAGPDEAAKTELVVYRDIETSSTEKEKLSYIQIYTDFMWKYAIKLLLERISGKRTEMLTLTFPSKFVLLR